MNKLTLIVLSMLSIPACQAMSPEMQRAVGSAITDPTKLTAEQFLIKQRERRIDKADADQIAWFTDKNVRSLELKKAGRSFSDIESELASLNIPAVRNFQKDDVVLYTIDGNFGWGKLNLPTSTGWTIQTSEGTVIQRPLNQIGQLKAAIQFRGAYRPGTLQPLLPTVSATQQLAAQTSAERAARAAAAAAAPERPAAPARRPALEQSLELEGFEEFMQTVPSRPSTAPQD